MKHPFANNTELSQSLTQAVSGGNDRAEQDRLNGLVPCAYKARITEDKEKKLRPPIGSTMAMGEEGGGRFHYY